MKDVFRIKERFEITERGTVFALEKNKDIMIQVGDILVDLWGNRFKVKGIERLRRMPDGGSLENMPAGILFESMDGVAASGNILVRDLRDISFRRKGNCTNQYTR